MPRISVIMPFYNAARYLRQSIESILNQTFGDFEFILIDDGSTDGSYDIARGFNDRRIILFRQERNMGLTRSLNKALAMVSPDAEFVARMDADDWSYPTRFERQVRFLEAHRDIAGVGCWYEIIGESARVLKTVRPSPAPSAVRRSLIWHSSIMHPSLMVRKEVLEKLGGYDEMYRFAEDRDLLLRITQTYKMSLVPEVLLKYRTSYASVSIQREREQKKASCLALYRAMCRGYCSPLLLIGVVHKALGAYLPMSVIKLQRSLWCLLRLRFVK